MIIMILQGKTLAISTLYHTQASARNLIRSSVDVSHIMCVCLLQIDSYMKERLCDMILVVPSWIDANNYEPFNGNHTPQMYIRHIIPALLCSNANRRFSLSFLSRRLATIFIYSFCLSLHLHLTLTFPLNQFTTFLSIRRSRSKVVVWVLWSQNSREKPILM